MIRQTAQQTTAQRRRTEWQGRLIDLTRRNRLVYFSPKGTQHLSLVEPAATAIFERLVAQEKAWEFWMPRQDASEVDEVDDETDGVDALQLESPAPPTSTGQVVKRKPSELVCRSIAGAPLRRIELERIIKKLYRRSKADYQERGVHILFVTFGMLRWRESPTSDVVQSPLILCPVELERETAADPYVLSMADEDFIPQSGARRQVAQGLQRAAPQSPP